MCPPLRSVVSLLFVTIVNCLGQAIAPLMHEFREIETCMERSSIKQSQVTEVFYYAQKIILHPIAPLFDQETQISKPHCVRALTRFFILCDHNRDGILNDAELNNFQMKCFNEPLQPSEIIWVKDVVPKKIAEGMTNDGLTLTGFLFEHGRLETTWTVLRKFGYDDGIKIRDDPVPNPSFKRASDQSIQSTDKALAFLKRSALGF